MTGGKEGGWRLVKVSEGKKEGGPVGSAFMVYGEGMGVRC